MANRVITPAALTYQRLVSRGSLDRSAGGIYNPAAWVVGSRTHLLCRREVDYTFRPGGLIPLLTSIETVTGHVGTATDVDTVGHHTGVRLEDFRALPSATRGLLISHTTVRKDAHGTILSARPGLSRLEEGLSGPVLVREEDVHLPLREEPIEKNWAFLEAEGLLTCVYSLSPLAIYQQVRGTWVLRSLMANDWATRLGKPPRLSTNPIPWGGGFLGAWHVCLDRAYFQGLYVLDADLQLVARSAPWLSGAWVQRDVYKPGVLYVTQLLPADGGVWAYYGEGDAHVGRVWLSLDAIEEALQ